VIASAFRYERPGTIEDGLAALADPEAKALAGGHSLLPMMRLRLAHPTAVVDIIDLPFRGISEEAGGVRVGALTTYDELLRRDPRITVAEAFLEGCESVGDLQVRNMGTIGGALAHADPSCDIAAPAIALDAKLQLRSVAGIRECNASDFFRGPYETALEQQELIEAVVIPTPPPGSGSGYVSVEDQASGYPIVGVAALVTSDGAIRLGITGAGVEPFRAISVEDALGRLGPAGNEDRAYVRHVTSVVAQRAIEAARSRIEV
jgi:aerobic carbon-monoxide dehydrogenase medium subunit